MAVVTPPQITPPPAAPQRGDRSTFRDRVDDFITWMIAVVAQFAALAQNVFNNATDAAASATNAELKRSEAAARAADALIYRNEAETLRYQAGQFTGQAQDARDAALAAAAALTATSSTSHTIGAGSKTFITQAGKQFAGQRLRLMNPTNNAQWMYGNVTSYSGTSLVVTIDDVNPATAGNVVANWLINIGGEKGSTGATGGLSGGNLTGALNERRTADVPVSATLDCWSSAGNLVPLMGSGIVNNFTTAPQAGAKRTLLMAQSGQAVTFENNANVIVFGGTQVARTNDEVDVVAIGVNYFRVDVRRADGTPVAFERGALHNLRVFGGSGVFTAPKTGWYKITVTGSSGSGATAVSSPTGHAGASGAGAGGFISGMRYLTAGVNYTVGVFAGGASVTASSSSFVAVNGNAGGNNFFSGAGITTMTANGGGGGLASIAPGAEIAGGVGGTATGTTGDMIVQGGSGGTVRALAADSPAASGGGAVGLRGLPYRGGDASAAGGFVAAGGGAGVGGRGGDATSTTASTLAGGGGCADTAISMTNAVATTAQAGANFQGTPGGGASFQMPNDLQSATGGGGAASSDGYAGGGGGGSSSASATVSGGAGFFAGGGGNAVRAGSNVGTRSGAGGAFGGAPGGAAQISSVAGNTVTAIGQAGRSGGVWIEW